MFGIVMPDGRGKILVWAFQLPGEVNGFARAVAALAAAALLQSSA
jgi:hypothetical protein